MLEQPIAQPETTFPLDNGQFSTTMFEADDEDWELDSIPQAAWFEYYMRMNSTPADDVIPAPTRLVQNAAKHLAGYIDAPTPDMFTHLCQLYNMFRLDEEVFLTALVTLYRYMGALGSKLVLNNASELFYLLVLCILISIKGLHDHPLELTSVAKELGLDGSRLAFNENQILVSLQYSLFFTAADLYPTKEELALDAEEASGTILRRHRRRGSLAEIFPIEGFLCLSYSAQKPKRPSILVEWARTHPRVKHSYVLPPAITTVSDTVEQTEAVSPVPNDSETPEQIKNSENTLDSEPAESAVRDTAPTKSSNSKKQKHKKQKCTVPTATTIVPKATTTTVVSEQPSKQARRKSHKSHRAQSITHIVFTMHTSQTFTTPNQCHVLVAG